MSKRLQSPKYRKLIKFFEGILDDPKESAKSKMTAALKLQEFYLEFEDADSKARAHSRKLELRALQIANPTLPLPEPDPVRSSVAVDDTVDEAVAFIKRGGKSATLPSDD